MAAALVVGRGQIARFAAGPCVVELVAQTAGHRHGSRTIIGIGTKLRRGGETYRHRGRNGDSERMGIGASIVADGTHHHSVGSIVGHIVDVPGIFFTAGGVGMFNSSSVADLKSHILRLLVAGGGQHRLSAGVERHLRHRRHIEGRAFSGPSYIIIISIYAEGVLHTGHTLTVAEEHRRGAQHSSVGGFHAPEARVEAVGIHPVLSAEARLQGSAHHIDGVGRESLIVTAVECRNDRHLVVVCEAGDGLRCAVASHRTDVGARGVDITAVVAVGDVGTGLSGHTTHIVGGAVATDVAGVVAVGKGGSILAHHTAGVALARNLAKVKTGGDRAGVVTGYTAHIARSGYSSAAVTGRHKAGIVASDTTRIVHALHHSVHHVAAIDSAGVVAGHGTHAAVVGSTHVGVHNIEVEHMTGVVAEETAGVGCSIGEVGHGLVVAVELALEGGGGGTDAACPLVAHAVGGAEVELEEAALAAGGNRNDVNTRTRTREMIGGIRGAIIKIMSRIHTVGERLKGGIVFDDTGHGTAHTDHKVDIFAETVEGSSNHRTTSILCLESS